MKLWAAFHLPALAATSTKTVVAAVSLVGITTVATASVILIGSNAVVSPQSSQHQPVAGSNFGGSPFSNGSTVVVVPKPKSTAKPSRRPSPRPPDAHGVRDAGSHAAGHADPVAGDTVRTPTADRRPTPSSCPRVPVHPVARGRADPDVLAVPTVRSSRSRCRRSSPSSRSRRRARRRPTPTPTHSPTPKPTPTTDHPRRLRRRRRKPTPGRATASTRSRSGSGGHLCIPDGDGDGDGGPSSHDAHGDQPDQSEHGDFHDGWGHGKPTVPPCGRRTPLTGSRRRTGTTGQRTPRRPRDLPPWAGNGPATMGPDTRSGRTLTG